MMNMSDKVAVVTGATQGIGLAIAGLLAEHGADIMLADLNVEEAKPVAKEIAARTGQRTSVVRVDVADNASAKEMIERAIAEFGRIDILINNAGTTRDNLIVRMKEADWDLVINVNLKGAWNCAQAAIRPMMKQRYGRIVNIASVSGLAGQAGQTNYSSSKAGIIGFTKALAKEVGSRNITVNAIAPGFIQTALIADMPQEFNDNILENTPLGRFGTTEDVANAVAFLVSDEAAFITGQVLSVDGGLVMQ